ncbi:MAG: redox-regulated ATPase YchF [Chloroflexota bacterium]|nr:redox-regulated ATPase YchF [Chloroflexota bacterium]
MNLTSAITGRPYVGKTTLFNLLCGGHATTGAFAGAEGETNVGVAKVPDERIDKLSALFRPKRTTHAEITYRDLGLAARAERGASGDAISAKKLGELRTADALIHVVRAFRDPSVPHSLGSVDPGRDLLDLDLELLLADLAVVERRLERIEPEMRSAKGAEREAREREKALLQRALGALESETPLRDLDIEPDELRLVRGYRFLTLSPQLVAVNVDESDVAAPDSVVAPLTAIASRHRGSAVVPVCAKIEGEIAELSPDEAAAFRAELGIADPAVERLLRATYRLLGLISFFTTGEDEVRAWTVADGIPAQQAAGAIHSDLDRGFIRAEVIRWDELLRAGSEANARRLGILRTEGKTYPVRDGDVLHILFNV